MPPRLTELDYAEHQVASKRRRMLYLAAEIEALERLIATLERTEELRVGAEDERAQRRS